MKQIIVLSLLLSIFLAGCNKPTIDTSTNDSMKSSMKEVRDSLEADQQNEFDNAITVIMFSKINMGGVLVGAFTGDIPDKEDMIDDLKKTLDGKTGLEIISEAKKLREETR